MALEARSLSPTVARWSVLVVDDDEDHLLLATDVLSGCYTVATARSGEAALSLLVDADWDALVLDFHLPDLTAAEVLRRAAQSGRAVPAVVFSAHPSARDKRLALHSGAAAYIVKSSTGFECLPSALRRAIERHRERACALAPPPVRSSTE